MSTTRTRYVTDPWCAHTTKVRVLGFLCVCKYIFASVEFFFAIQATR